MAKLYFDCPDCAGDTLDCSTCLGQGNVYREPTAEELLAYVTAELRSLERTLQRVWQICKEERWEFIKKSADVSAAHQQGKMAAYENVQRWLKDVTKKLEE